MSGHWYDADGVRHDTVTGAKGAPVRPDIRHARKLDLCPGVTTIIRAAASEPLTRWREERVLQVAQMMPRGDGEDEATYIARVIMQSKELAEETMSAGSDVHQLVEDRLLDPECDHPTILAVQKLLEPISGERPLHDWRSEEPAVSRWGYATRADLMLPQELDHDGAVIDMKTKDGDVVDARVYDDHAMQLGATRAALGMPSAPTGILFLSRTIPGNAKLVMLDEEQVQAGWRMFRALLRFWQLKNKHMPSWADIAARMEATEVTEFS